MERSELVRRAQQYADRKGSVLKEPLGFGVHGNVFSVEHQSESARTAIKAHEQEAAYVRERDVYLRLREHEVSTVRECNVPQLLGYDDELLVIEMTIVARPFLLDFGGAYLDGGPEFSEEVWADWRSEKQEQFGSFWPEVQRILAALEGYGIHVHDVNPGNISFAD